MRRRNGKTAAADRPRFASSLLRRVVPVIAVASQLLAACAPTATISPGNPTATGTLTSTSLVSASPDPALTAEAERVKATFQAFQTQTAAEKATERAAAEAGPTEWNTTTRSPTADPDSAQKLPADLKVIGPENLPRLQRLFSFSPGPIEHAVLSADRQILGLAFFDSDTILLYTMDDLSASPRELVGHQAGITSLETEAAHSVLVSTSRDGSVRIWDLAGNTAQWIAMEDFIGSPAAPTWARFSPDGDRFLVYAAEPAVVLLWDTAALLAGSGRPETVAWQDYSGQLAALRLSDGWQYLAWTSLGRLQVMTIDGEPLGEPIDFEEQIGRVAFSPDESILVVDRFSSDGNSTLRADVLAPPGALWETDLPAGLLDWFIGPAGLRLVYSLSNAVIAGLEMSRGGEIWRLDLPEPAGRLVRSPDGQLAIAVSSSGNLFWIESATGRLLATTNAGGDLRTILFSDDGKLLTTVTLNGLLLFWGAP